MKFSQIRAFHYVATSGGFSRAAELLSLTQPAVSEQVRKLEAEHDLLLFNRERKQITLTPAAERLLLRTKQLFEIEEQIDDLLSENRATLSGHLRIMVDSAFHLSGRLVAFRARYPDVSISIRTGNSEEVLSCLRNYDVEIGVIGSLDPGSDMVVESLGSSPIVAVSAKTYFEPAGREYSLAEMAQFPLILRERGSKTRQRLEEEAEERGVRLHPIAIVEGREAMLEMVAAGVGIGFVSEAEFGSDPRLARTYLAGSDLSMSEALVYLKQRADLRIIKSFLRG